MKALAAALMVFSMTASANGDHWDSRRAIIAMQSQVVGAGQVLMLGDSITEQLWVPSVGGKKILNAGLMGADIDAVYATAAMPLPAAKVTTLLVGINNCANGYQADPLEWGAKYRQLVGMIRAKSTPVLVEILPTASYANYDKSCIQSLNWQIEQVAAETGSALLNLTRLFADVAGNIRPELTLDGVHLSGAGANLLGRCLKSMVARELTK